MAGDPNDAGPSERSATGGKVSDRSAIIPTQSGSGRRSPLVALVAIVAVVAVVAALFVVTNGFRGRAGSGDELIPALSYYSLPAEQYNDVAFIAHSTSVINGTFTNSLGLIVYIMTPSQIASLNHNGVVGTYNWSSGPIPEQQAYGLRVTVQPGQWNLVFLNPNTAAINTTVVGFYTAVTLSPS
jgi:hypothetical protein